MKPKFFTILMAFIVSGILLQSCHVARYFFWNFADAGDYKKFHSVPVAKSEQPSYFTEASDFSTSKNNNIQLPAAYRKEAVGMSFSDFLADHQTLAFLVIKNDTILYEAYFSNYADSSVIPSFSVSKVFVSALTGIAIQEKFIKSANESITTYIPELLKNDSAFAKIAIEDLLNMRSGIKFTEGYANPFADMAKFYYGRNLQKYISNLQIENPPNEKYKYISVNTLLLATIIERSTGQPLNQYLSKKIWQPLGMEFDATWSVDSKKFNQIKAFCCINARAKDFAKLGRLYLNHGNWNGRQIIPEKWVEKSMTIVNDSKDSQGFAYTYNWRVKHDGAIFAKGVLGQYIYVEPSKNMIVVRLGRNATDLNWADFFENLCNDF